jgi:glycosyltransferase involved in cell wall biosynthesis
VVTGWPSVGVVLPTHDRPELLRLALRAVLAQDYPGELEVIVVFDRNTPDGRLARQDARRPVRVVTNSRTPGLAGARNTGILALDTELVAFCDDDDEWHPQKLTRQVCRLLAQPRADMVTCGIEVAYDDQVVPRLAGADEVRHEDLVRSRMAMLHSSTFLLRRCALVDLGMVAEDAPGSQNEDYDLLLRFARRQPVQHVDDPLVRVRWGATSHFAAAYRTKIESLEWMLDRHPELADDGPGSARIYGQLACWYAAGGAQRPARRWAGRALRARWREPRAVIALAASAHVVRVETVLSVLHRRGRGI